MNQIAFVGLSSNLPLKAGGPADNLDCALGILREKAKILAISERYLTAPVGVKEAMPDFLNQVVKISWPEQAPQLLDLLLNTETRLGRVRSPDESRGALARTLDLDLLLFGRERWALPELTVPHPRMFVRAFVLVPLLDIWQESDSLPIECGNSREYLESCLGKLAWSLDNRYIIQKEGV